MSPGARAGIRSRQAARLMRAPFSPSWRFRDRNSRGGPALHLAAAWPRPNRFHPRGAGTSGRRWRTCRVPSTNRASIRRSSHSAGFQITRFSPPRRNPPTFSLPSGFDAFRRTIRSSCFDEWMLPATSESFKLCKADLSTIHSFSSGLVWITRLPLLHLRKEGADGLDSAAAQQAGISGPVSPAASASAH
jgi:hypothetical protein